MFGVFNWNDRKRKDERQTTSGFRAESYSYPVVLRALIVTAIDEQHGDGYLLIVFFEPDRKSNKSSIESTIRVTL